MPRKVYCGMDPLKEGQKRGTLEECTKMKQVRYYGVKKIDPDKVKQFRVPKEKRELLLTKIGKVTGKLNRLKKNAPFEKDPVKKEKMKEDYRILVQEFNKLNEKLKELDKDKPTITFTDKEFKEEKKRKRNIAKSKKKKKGDFSDIM